MESWAKELQEESRIVELQVENTVKGLPNGKFNRKELQVERWIDERQVWSLVKEYEAGSLIIEL